MSPQQVLPLFLQLGVAGAALGVLLVALWMLAASQRREDACKEALQGVREDRRRLEEVLKDNSEALREFARANRESNETQHQILGLLQARNL